MLWWYCLNLSAANWTLYFHLFSFQVNQRSWFYYRCNTSIHSMKMVFTLCRSFLTCQWSMVKVKQARYYASNLQAMFFTVWSPYRSGAIQCMKAAVLCVTVSAMLAVCILPRLMIAKQLTCITSTSNWFTFWPGYERALCMYVTH